MERKDDEEKDERHTDMAEEMGKQGVRMRGCALIPANPNRLCKTGLQIILREQLSYYGVLRTQYGD